jgi:hypothetical protein
MRTDVAVAHAIDAREAVDAARRRGVADVVRSLQEPPMLWRWLRIVLLTPIVLSVRRGIASGAPVKRTVRQHRDVTGDGRLDEIVLRVMAEGDPRRHPGSGAGDRRAAATHPLGGTAVSVEEQLLEPLHALPPAQQAEVLDFAEFLRLRVMASWRPVPRWVC